MASRHLLGPPLLQLLLPLPLLVLPLLLALQPVGHRVALLEAGLLRLIPSD